MIGQLEVSLVGLGCNNFGKRIDAAATDAVVGAALDAGITLFDTADVYGGDGRSEQLLGAALGDRRDDVVIATKFGMPLDDRRRGAHPDYVRAACDASLRRIGTDRIDLYQMHEPDPEVPIAETIGALHDLVTAGKVREIGHSNMTAAGVAEADDAATHAGTARFVCAQEQWSLLERGIEHDVLPAIERYGLRLLPYFPLAAGLLTGKYRAGQEPDRGWRLGALPAEQRRDRITDTHLATVERLRDFATDRGRTLLELAMSWLACQPTVASVIAGATTPEQVHANVDAAGWTIDPDDLAELDVVTGRWQVSR